MAYSTQNILTWAAAAQPLAARGEKKAKYLKGRAVDLDLHIQIYVERTSLAWQYAQDPTDSDGILFQQGNYVYALLFPYLFAAQQATGGGGQVVTPTVPGLRTQYNFVVGATATATAPLADGQTTVYFTEFIGLNLLVNKNGTPLIQDPTSFVYYSWNTSTGQLVVTPAAFLGDIFQITAV